MPTTFRCDHAFLKQLLTEAIRLHTPKSVEEATMLADVRDYIMHVALDAFEDPKLARQLVDRFSQLQKWLEEKLQDTPVWRDEREAIRFYIGMLFTLEQLLSLRHEIAMLPSEKISREDFNRSWKRTAQELGLEDE
jgi:hypothetical protein